MKKVLKTFLINSKCYTASVMAVIGSFFIQGIIIGLLVSIPLGPIGFLLVQRSVSHGVRAGFFSGLAIATIDSVFACMLLLGLQGVAFGTHHTPFWIRAAGSIVIFFYGVRVFSNRPQHPAKEDTAHWSKHFLSMLGITLANPSTYFSFGAIAIILIRFLNRSVFDRLEIIIGFFIGALVWWSFLSWFAFTKRSHYVNSKVLHRLIGVAIMALALFTLARPILKMLHYDHENRPILFEHSH